MNSDLLELDQLQNVVLAKKQTVSVPSKGGSDISGDNALLKEIERKISELKSQIKRNEEQIKINKTNNEDLHKKLKDDEDYIRKILPEKRVYLDQVDEYLMRDLGMCFYI